MNALYFSTQVIPHAPNHLIRPPVYLHIGLYGYRAGARHLCRPRLHRHRGGRGAGAIAFPHAGVPIRLIEVCSPPGGIWEVDNPTDIPSVERRCRAAYRLNDRIPGDPDRRLRLAATACPNGQTWARPLRRRGRLPESCSVRQACPTPFAGDIRPYGRTGPGPYHFPAPFLPSAARRRHSISRSDNSGAHSATFTSVFANA